MINTSIKKLVSYAFVTGLIGEEDIVWATNRVLETLGLSAYEEPEECFTQELELMSEAEQGDFLEQVLKELLDFACAQGLCEDNVTSRDLFDTKLMGLLTPRPSVMIRDFYRIYEDTTPRMATDMFYKWSQDSDYIRRYRIKKDMRWLAPTEYGDIDITINLSKPEKDPKAIAAARKAVQSGYPKCLLCYENVGYAGRADSPARQNHRVIPLSINNEEWGFQYSPYVYYNEHCIVFNRRHTPMVIDRSVFVKLFDFIDRFPHYTIGSNADLPIVGGSILSHEHFQGGNYEFAMAKAPVEQELTFTAFEQVKAGIVKWPMSVIRLRSADRFTLTELADRIQRQWRGYTDESLFIFAETDGEPHNTVTPIARMRDGEYELDLVLRNNITTPEHPLGVYHPHAELHHIKKENIGLIEVMGLAVLPSRLKGEMSQLAEAILAGKDLRADETLAKHADWAEDFLSRNTVTADNIHEIIRNEIGTVFAKVLEHAGVYKRDEAGKAGFMRFAEYVNANL
ncbi:MAG: UDP-glucose--hexose-1-phosphate uridylyltransferase [Ruminococcus sp.]|nr:UDP-glucose--hexose-1-phosphate uridylyltransferase [Ruminococcus sp.]